MNYDIAYKLVSKYNTRDPLEIADYLRINLIEEYFDNVYGIVYIIKKQRFIILNKNMEALHKKIVCAHEIGHLLLHKNLNHFFLKPKNTFFN